jgi:hypothetical protein
VQKAFRVLIFRAVIAHNHLPGRVVTPQINCFVPIMSNVDFPVSKKFWRLALIFTARPKRKFRQQRQRIMWGYKTYLVFFVSLAFVCNQREQMVKGLDSGRALMYLKIDSNQEKS